MPIIYMHIYMVISNDILVQLTKPIENWSAEYPIKTLAPVGRPVAKQTLGHRSHPHGFISTWWQWILPAWIERDTLHQV